MKSQLLTAISCLVLGAATAWILKPDSLSDQSQTEAAPSKSARPGTSSTGSINNGPSDLPESKISRITSGGPGMDSEHATLLGRDFHNNMMSKMATRQAKEFDAKIARLVKKLSLDTTQEAALRKFYADKNQAIEEHLSGTGARDGKSIAEVSALMNHDGLEETLGDLLTDEQKVAYGEMKTQDLHRKVESGAYKALAKINTALELTDTQKDAVYDVLYHEQAARYEDGAQTSHSTSVMINGMGIELDEEAMGLSALADLDPATLGDPAGMKTALAKAQEDRINAKVSRFDGILDEEQQQTYRDQLSSQTQNSLGGLLIGGDGENMGISTSIQIIGSPSPETP